MSDIRTCAFTRYGFLGEGRERPRPAAVEDGYGPLLGISNDWYGAVDRFELTEIRMLDTRAPTFPEVPWRRPRADMPYRYRPAASPRRFY
ncbi:MAG: hypothetical protein V4682_01440 [Patescibacteria group bacterium]